MDEELAVPEALAGERRRPRGGAAHRLDAAARCRTWWRTAPCSSTASAVAKSRRLEAGEVIELLGRADRPRPARSPIPRSSVDVRYEDDDVLVVAKPAGLVVHPGAGHPDGTLVNGLLARYPEIARRRRPGASRHRAPPRPRHERAARGRPLARGVRRAGRDARRARGRARLPRARVGPPRFAAGRHRRADRPLGPPPDPHGGARGRAHRPHHLRRARRVPGARSCRCWRARSRPVARTRSGCTSRPSATPWWATRLRRARPGLDLGRPFLHATAVAFAHPVTGERIVVEEPLPPELAAVLDRLGDPLDTTATSSSGACAGSGEPCEKGPSSFRSAARVPRAGRRELTHASPDRRG